MSWKRRQNRGGSTLIEGDLQEYLANIFQEEAEKGYEVKVAIGTDSQKRGKGFKFATAIVIDTRQSMGMNTKTGKEEFVGRGSMVIYKTDYIEHMDEGEINKRMLMEVGKSIEVGYELWPFLDELGIELEIHADVNQDPRWGSNTALGQVRGYIDGMGWVSKVKPDAYAASTAADDLC